MRSFRAARTPGAGVVPVARRRTRLLLICALAASVAAVAVASSPARAAGTSTNPVRPVSSSDAQADPSHGFGVLVEHDATLLSNESDTAIAIGGVLTFGTYQELSEDTSAYTVAGDSRPTSLVAGSVDWDASTSVLQVNSGSGAKIGGSYTINNQNINGPRLVKTGGGFDSHPRIDIADASQAQNNSTGPSGFDLTSLFTTYRSVSDELSGLTDTGVLLNDAGKAPWTSGNARLKLVPGQNVLNLTPAQFNAITAINPADGGAQYGPDTWLIINIIGSGDIDLTGPTSAVTNAGGSSPALHILWNFTTAGTVTLNGTDEVEGTVYAPRAHLVDDSGKNIEGDVVAASLHEGGGEIHARHFGNTVDFPPGGGTTTPPAVTTSTVTQTVTATATTTKTATKTATVTATATVTDTDTVTATKTVTASATVTAPGSTTTVTAPASTATVTAPASTATVTAPGTTETVTAPASTATVTAPASTATVTAPGTTATVTAPASTATVTAPASTATVTAPASTATVTAPASTATVTAPASTATVTAPGTTQTQTVTAPASTSTVTAPGATVTKTVPADPSSSVAATATSSTAMSTATSSPAGHGVAAASTSRAASGAPRSATAGLANTGADITTPLIGGLVLLFGGIGLLLLARGRRRDDRRH